MGRPVHEDKSNQMCGAEPLADIYPKMYRLLLVSATMALISSPIGTSAQLPNGQCSTENITCGIEDDNLVGIASNVADLSDCSDITNEGRYFSYYGSEGFPFANSCLFFSSCQSLVTCEDCVTQDIACDRPTRPTFCSAPIEGTLGANLVAVIDNVGSEEECDSSCQLEEQCAVYTFRRGNDSTYPNTCFLLSALGEPVRECEDATCVTGLPNCKGSICAYVEGGIMFPQGMLVIIEEKDIELLTLGLCPLPVAIAIGGGGSTNRNIYGAGGGSGYMSYSATLPHKAYIKMHAYPGLGFPLSDGGNEDSYVRDVSDNMDIVRGEYGRGGTSYVGGAGFSGGGGGSDNGCGNGGSNGSDGQPGDGDYGEGGAGSGVHISTIKLTSFVLSPGEGGITGQGEYIFGGGGGGVLINGKGPPAIDPSSGGWGTGFGGGGSNGFGGLPGAVIFDFLPDE